MEWSVVTKSEQLQLKPMVTSSPWSTSKGNKIMIRAKNFKCKNIVTWLALFSLVLSMFTGIISGVTASAQNNTSENNQSNSDDQAHKSADKVSTDLREQAQQSQDSGQE